MKFNPGKVSQKKQIELYKLLLKPRLIEEKMLKLLRHGRISKWFSGIGQEAISIGATYALQEDEVVFPMHRNLGVFTTRDVPLKRLFTQWQGKETGFTNGRDRSFHFGTMEYNIVGMISHLGPQLALADGVALAHKLKKEQKISLAFTGEGGTSEGDFHEALNVASVWNLPVIFIIENNGYGLSTPVSEQYNCKDLADRALGYGMESHIVDGNNVLEVYQTVDRLARKIRKNPKPILLECKTFRMRGHEEASGTKYVPPELLDEWIKRDPIEQYGAFLKSQNLISDSDIETWQKEIKEEIDTGLNLAAEVDEIAVDLAKEMNDVHKPFAFVAHKENSIKSKKRLIDAVSDGLNEAMLRHDNLVLMGQDIADYGGVFKVTDGFLKRYGKDRVRNTPICESAIIGTALGLSLKGFKSMVEMQFADFVTCGFNQIINNLAKIHYRWGQNADVVVRMPCGGGVGAGPFHSQSNEAWFFHTPGLKVFYPSTPYEAKGLLLTAIEDPNPVIFFEHKALYRSSTEMVPNGYYTIEPGKANVVRSGTSATIITYGLGVLWAKEVVEALSADVEILDLRTLAPLDYDGIRTSVMKTNKALVLHEDTLTGGIGGEISAFINEHLFEHLDGPVMRCASLDTPIPFAKPLENQFMGQSRLKEKLERLLSY